MMRDDLGLEMSNKREQGLLKKSWKKLVKEVKEKIGLKMEDALYPAMWRDGVRRTVERIR